MPHIPFRLLILSPSVGSLKGTVKPRRLIDLVVSTVLISAVVVGNSATLKAVNASENTQDGDANSGIVLPTLEGMADTDAIAVINNQPHVQDVAGNTTFGVGDEFLQLSSVISSPTTPTFADDNNLVLHQSASGETINSGVIAQADPQPADGDESVDEDPFSVPPPTDDQPILTPEILNSIMGQPGGIESPEFDVYRLGPGDGIFVSVQRFPDLSFQATLDLEGNVIVPIEGSINLEGFTLAQAEERIRQIYDQYVVNPDVDLTLTAQRPVEVTVLGEVVRPGFYPLPAPQVSTALLASGGATGFADLRSVQIRRQLPDGQVVETEVDLFTPLAEGDAIPDLRLENGDVMVIPRLDLSELDEYDRFLVSQSTLARESITIRALNYAGGRGINANFAALELPNGSRLLDAVTAARVNPDSANFREVALVRFDPVEGRAVTVRFDIFAALEGDLSQNPPLQNNDVLIANRNFINRITFALNTFTQPFRDILGFLLFFDNLADSADDLFGP